MNVKYLRLAILHSIDEDKLTKCEYVMLDKRMMGGE